MNPYINKNIIFNQQLNTNKMEKTKTIIPVMISLFLFSCGNNSSNKSNSELPGIKIGTQTWAAKNLDVSSFRNGDAIPEAKTDAEWTAAGKEGKPACCYYDNDPANGAKYGKLYNWYAVNDPRGLAPKGWHIPSDKEWAILTTYLGGENGAGTQKKSSNGWKDNGNGSNSSGLAALPGGYRFPDGSFYAIGNYCHWWSSSEFNTINAWYSNLYGDGGVERDSCPKRYGYSVRCLRD